MDGRLALYSGAVFAGMLIAGTLIIRPGFGDGGSTTGVEASSAALATESAVNAARPADSVAVTAAPAVSRGSHDGRSVDDDHEGGDHDEEDDD